MSDEIKPYEAPTSRAAAAAVQLAADRVLPPSIKSRDVAAMLISIGDRFGWDPLFSLHNIQLIQGRPTLPAATQMGLIRQRCPQAKIVAVQCDNEAAVISVSRDGEPPVQISFTADDAKRAGLSGDNWRKYPSDMLWARCVSRVARRIFPDVTLGIYVPEDIQAGKVVQDFSDLEVQGG